MIGQKVDTYTCDFEIETSSFNEELNYSTNHTHFRGLYFTTMKTNNYTQLQTWKMWNIKTNTCNNFNCI